MKIDNDDALDELRNRLAKTLARLTASQQAVQSGAVHSEAKQEHPKDTRATEAGYLSRGLAERVETLCSVLCCRLRDSASSMGRRIRFRDAI